MTGMTEVFPSASEQVAEELRARIFDGRMGPGDRLVVARIAEDLEVSTMPVREALKTLERDGLAEGRPGFGCRVVRLSEERVRGLRYLRKAVECQAARLCAVRATPVQIAELRALAREADAFLDEAASSARSVAAERALHLRVAQIAGVPELTDTLVRVVNVAGLATTDDETLWINTHEELVADIASGDPDRAEGAMRDHLTVRSEYERIQRRVQGGEETVRATSSKGGALERAT